MSTFADTITDAVAGRVGWGAVGCGEGMCNLGGFVVWNDESLGGKSALQSQGISLRVIEGCDGDQTYTAVLCGCLLPISEELYRPLLHLLVRSLLWQRLRRVPREGLLPRLVLPVLFAHGIVLPVPTVV